MTLFIVGNIDPEETMNWIRENQAAKTFSAAKEIKRQFPEETVQEIIPESIL